MQTLDLIGYWLNLVMFLLFSAAGFMWGCILVLRARGGINNKESSAPGLAFCARIPRRLAGQLAIVALAIGFFSLIGANAQWQAIAAKREFDHRIAKLQNIGTGLVKLSDEIFQGLVEEHQAALDSGNREQLCQSIIDSANKQNCEVLLGVSDLINDSPMRMSLLYCFQEISGIDLEITLDSQLNEKELAAKIAEAKRKCKDAGH